MKHKDPCQRAYWALREFHDRKKQKLPDAVGFRLPPPREDGDE